MRIMAASWCAMKHLYTHLAIRVWLYHTFVLPLFLCFRAHNILIAHFSDESPPRKEETEHEHPTYGEVTLSVDFSIVCRGLW